MRVSHVMVVLFAAGGFASPVKLRTKLQPAGNSPANGGVFEIVDFTVVEEVEYMENGHVVSKVFSTKVNRETVRPHWPMRPSVAPGPHHPVHGPTVSSGISEPCESSETIPAAKTTELASSASFPVVAPTFTTTPGAATTSEPCESSHSTQVISTTPSVTATTTSPVSGSGASSSSVSSSTLPVSTSSSQLPPTSSSPSPLPSPTTTSSELPSTVSSSFPLSSPLTTSSESTHTIISTSSTASVPLSSDSSAESTTIPSTTLAQTSSSQSSSTTSPSTTPAQTSSSQPSSTSGPSVTSIPVPPEGALSVGYVDMDTDPDHFATIALWHHNVHRANHSAPAMVWNNTLFDWAKTKAKNCTFNEETYDYMQGVGMNIAGGTYGTLGQKNVPNPSSMISGLWYNSEINNFPAYGEADLNTNAGDFDSWGHFTQVVWPSSIQLGCGLSDCGDSWFGACFYHTAGNVGGQWNSVGRPLGHPIVYPNGQTSM